MSDYLDAYFSNPNMAYGDPIPDSPYAGRPAPADSYSGNYDIAKERGAQIEYGDPIPPIYLWGSPKELQKLAPPPPTQTPAQQYPDQPPIDFSGAPAWWGKGGQAPQAPSAPQVPQAPTSAPARSSNPMVSLLSAGGGTTKVGRSQAMSKALRAMGG